MGRRLLSLAYDAVLLAALLLACGVAYTIFTVTVDPIVTRPAFQVYLLSVAGAYFVWQWHRGGQTLAMKTWRIRLVSHSGEGLSWQVATARFLLAIPGVLLLGLGYFWAVFDRNGQYLHDRLAGTRIVCDDE